MESPPSCQDFELGGDLSVTTEVGCLGPFGQVVQLNAPAPDYYPHPNPEGLKGGTGSPTRSFTLGLEGPGVNRYVSVR